MSPHYLVELKATQNSQSLAVVRTLESVAHNFCRKLFNILFSYFIMFLEHCLNNRLAENLVHSQGFPSKISVHKLTFNSNVILK